jgi:hypothetical protein
MKKMRKKTLKRGQKEIEKDIAEDKPKIGQRRYIYIIGKFQFE